MKKDLIPSSSEALCLGEAPGAKRSRWPGILSLLVAATFLAVEAPAHDDAYLDSINGPHGGQMRVAGNHHLELVVQPPGAGLSEEEGVIAVYLTDHADQAVPSDGYGGRAVILANHERLNVALVPAGDNRLAGQGRFSDDQDMVVVVTLTLPDQGSEQVRFTPYKYLDGSPRGAHSPADPDMPGASDMSGHAHHHH